MHMWCMLPGDGPRVLRVGDEFGVQDTVELITKSGVLTCLYGWA
jgi:hypothetical protein